MPPPPGVESLSWIADLKNEPLKGPQSLILALRRLMRNGVDPGVTSIPLRLWRRSRSRGGSGIFLRSYIFRTMIYMAAFRPLKDSSQPLEGLSNKDTQLQNCHHRRGRLHLISRPENVPKAGNAEIFLLFFIPRRRWQQRFSVVVLFTKTNVAT